MPGCFNLDTCNFLDPCGLGFSVKETQKFVAPAKQMARSGFARDDFPHMYRRDKDIVKTMTINCCCKSKPFIVDHCSNIALMNSNDI